MNTEIEKSDPIKADAQMHAESVQADGARVQDERRLRPLPEDALIILPVRNVVLFPGVVLPITVGRSRSRAAAQHAARTQRPIGVLLQRNKEIEEPGADDLYWIGTTANVLRYVTGPDGSHHVIAQGEQRFRVLQFLDGWEFPVARVQRIEEHPATAPELEARALSLKQRAVEILRMLPQVPEEMITGLDNVTGPARLADLVAGLMDASIEEKQAILETFDLKTRLDKLLEHLSRRAEVLRLSQEISEKTRESIDQKGREHLLREQMRSIQKELGEGEDTAAEVAELAKKIDEAKMPPEVEKQARKELKRLEPWPKAPASTRWCAPISTGSSSCPGRTRRRLRSTLPGHGACSTRITTDSTRSRSAFSSTSRCGS
jgi:ATP-dependent Lon protease